MDGIDILQERIAEETQSQVDNILTNAKQQRDAMLEEARREASAIRQEQDERERRLAEEKAVQQQALGRLQTRREVLQTKQEILRETLQEARRQLLSYPPAKRRALYEKWLHNAGVSGHAAQASEHAAQASGQEITVALADASWFPAYLAEAFPTLQIRPEMGTFTGGFILTEGRSRQDYRFDSVLSQNENRLLAVAAGVLFREDKDE